MDQFSGMDKQFIEAQLLFDQNDLAGSLQVLNQAISGQNADLQLFGLRARIRFKLQDWGGAMNDYTSVLELEPDNQEAKSGLEMSRNILGFFNPDMFNP